jgi:hypothetical protein
MHRVAGGGCSHRQAVMNAHVVSRRVSRRVGGWHCTRGSGRGDGLARSGRGGAFGSPHTSDSFVCLSESAITRGQNPKQSKRFQRGTQTRLADFVWRTFDFDTTFVTTEHHRWASPFSPSRYSPPDSRSSRTVSVLVRPWNRPSGPSQIQRAPCFHTGKPSTQSVPLGYSVVVMSTVNHGWASVSTLIAAVALTDRNPARSAESP